MVFQSYPSVFVLIVKLNKLLCTQNDDFLFGGIQLFLNNVIAPIKCTVTIGAQHCAAFRYLGLKINQPSTEIILDQID